MKDLNRNQKRTITYTILTIIFFIIAKMNDTGIEEESLIAYMAGIGYLVSGFILTFVLITRVIVYFKPIEIEEGTNGKL